MSTPLDGFVVGCGRHLSSVGCTAAPKLRVSLQFGGSKSLDTESKITRDEKMRETEGEFVKDGREESVYQRGRQGRRLE